MADAHNAADDGGNSLTALAVEMGFITPQEAQLTHARRDALRRGGIKMTVGQTLIERRFVEPFQIKILIKELQRRKALIAPSPNITTASPPRMLGNYALLEILSEKTHSRIIKAHDIAMDRMVVLKILPNTLKSDPQWSERFRRETMLLGKMAHPNLVQAYAAQEIEGSPVIAMEFVEGSSVGDRIENEGFLPEKEAWLIGREIAKALAYAARVGVIHRDIKPDNIVCSRGGKVKLIDMGFSKSLTDTTQLTVEGTTVGTPFYISPEQARGTKDLDARTDIYSLGCTIFHMLTGSPPFWGDEITDVMLKHIEAKRPDPRNLVQGITDGSASLVMRMMAVRPEKRPQSGDEVVEEITALLPLLPSLFAPAQSQSLQRKRSGTVNIAPPPRQTQSSAHTKAVAPERAASNSNLKPYVKHGFWVRFKSWFGF